MEESNGDGLLKVVTQFLQKERCRDVEKGCGCCKNRLLLSEG